MDWRKDVFLRVNAYKAMMREIGYPSYLFPNVDGLWLTLLYRAIMQPRMSRLI